MDEYFLVGISSVIALGISAQWLAWRTKLPAILLLLVFGIIAGPVTGWINPETRATHVNASARRCGHVGLAAQIPIRHRAEWRAGRSAARGDAARARTVAPGAMRRPWRRA